jgi:hypothetical protein
MKKYKLLFIITLLIGVSYLSVKYRLSEYLGIQKNILQVKAIDDKIIVKWIGEKEFLRQGFDTLTIYSNGKNVHDIPNNYGKNYIYITYGKYKFEKIGIVKFTSWHKHKYELDVVNNSAKPYIKWKISNNYELNQGICYPNLQ